MNYDIKAVTWDTDKRTVRAKVISEEINKAIEIKRTFTALEFGCGTGLVSFNLCDRFHEITLIDTSKGMIDILNTKIQQNKIQNMAAYQLDINNQDILTKKYDVIYTSMVLHHILDLETVIKNLSGLIKTGGHLFIIDIDGEDGSFHKDEEDFKGHNGFNQEVLGKLLEKLGFSEVESHNFYTDVKIIGTEEIKYTLFLMKGQKV